MSDAPVFLTDFGLARDTATGSRLTRTGVTLGTPAYMSPEQARGELAELGPASDVWALGCVLYECLTGSRAFDQGDPAAVIAAILTGPPPRVVGRPPTVPRGACELVAVALARRPADRPADAAGLREQLDRVRRGDRPTIRPRVPVRAVGGGTLVAVGAGALIVGLTWTFQTETTPPEPPTAPADVRCERAWARRLDAPADAERRLETELAGGAPARWGMHLGLLRWTREADAEAQAAWVAVPLEDPAGPRARVYCALAAIFRPGRTRRDLDEIRRWLTQARTGDASTRQLADALEAALASQWMEMSTGLAGVPGWEAAYLRGLAGDRIGAPPAERVAEYSTVIAAGVAPRAVHLALAQALHSLGRLGAAREVCDAVLARHPTDATALNLRGMLHRAAGEADAALRDFDAAAEADPAMAAVFVNRSNARWDAGDQAGALADLDRALALAPDAVVARVNRAWRLHALGRRDEALADADRAVAEGDPSGSGHYLRGVLRAQAGDLAAAIADYDRALAVGHRPQSVRYARARAHWLMGDAPAAARDCEAVLQHDPDAIDALLLRGVLAAGRNDLVAALRDFDRALSVAPENVDARVARARALRLSGRVAEAIADLDVALRVGGDDHEPLVTRGLLRLNVGDADGARRDLQRAAELVPTDVNGLLGLADAYSVLAQPAAGVAVLRRAQQLAPTSPRVALALGRDLHALGQYADAAQELRRFLATARPGAHADWARTTLRDCEARLAQGR